MKESATSDELLALATAVLEQKDRFAVVELLSRHDVQLAAGVYGKLQSELYWKRKVVPLMVMISQAGIQHGLTEAGRADDETKAHALRSSAKQLAYNLASFTWPGWDDQGITLDRSDLAAGLDAARLNLRLAEELDRPARGKANAWWALGAHQLAIADYPRAAEAFLRAKSHALLAEAATVATMLDGYALMARVLAEPADGELRAKFDDIVASLKKDTAEDAAEYGSQLAVAIAVFSRSEK